MDEDCDCAKVRNGNMRLNFILSEKNYQELRQLAKAAKVPWAKFAKTAIALATIVFEAKLKGHKIMLCEDQGDGKLKAIKEYTFPKEKR